MAYLNAYQICVLLLVTKSQGKSEVRGLTHLGCQVLLEQEQEQAYNKPK